MPLTAADQAAIAKASQQTGVPTGLLSAIALQESAGDPNARNASSGATGLFQILPSTAASPGYGVAPFVGNLTDPDSSALFAAQYLSAQDKRLGSWDAAVSQYSGGAYSLSTLASKYPDQIGGSATVNDGLDGGITGGGIGTGGAPATGPGGSAGLGGTAISKLLDPLWEVVSRGLLIVVGLAILMVALIAMLFQSKTVQVSAQHLATAAA